MSHVDRENGRGRRIVNGWEARGSRPEEGHCDAPSTSELGHSRRLRHIRGWSDPLSIAHMPPVAEKFHGSDPPASVTQMAQLPTQDVSSPQCRIVLIEPKQQDNQGVPCNRIEI